MRQPRKIQFQVSPKGRFLPPVENSPASAFLKNWISAAPPSPEPRISLDARWAPARLAAPGHQILSVSSRFGLGIPIPMPAKTAPLRADLEHLGRGAESQVFSGREGETP
jgi:hypothetical protein